MPASHDRNRVKELIQGSPLRDTKLRLCSQVWPGTWDSIGQRLLPLQPRPLLAHPPPRPDPGSLGSRLCTPMQAPRGPRGSWVQNGWRGGHQTLSYNLSRQELGPRGFLLLPKGCYAPQHHQVAPRNQPLLGSPLQGLLRQHIILKVQNPEAEGPQ